MTDNPSDTHKVLLFSVLLLVRVLEDGLSNEWFLFFYSTCQRLVNRIILCEKNDQVILLRFLLKGSWVLTFRFFVVLKIARTAASYSIYRLRYWVSSKFYSVQVLKILYVYVCSIVPWKCCFVSYNLLAQSWDPFL